MQRMAHLFKNRSGAKYRVGTCTLYPIGSECNSAYPAPGRALPAVVHQGFSRRTL